MKYYFAAAQEGNLIGIYHVAYMNQHGLGTAASCTMAASLYKKVAERGPWMKEINDAYELYQKGRYAGALLRYEKSAEMGKNESIF